MKSLDYGALNTQLFPQPDEKFAYNAAYGAEASLSGYLVANWIASKKFYGRAIWSFAM